MGKLKPKFPRQDYDVTIKATLKLRVKSANAYKAILEAENVLESLEKYLLGADLDIVDYKVISSSSVEHNETKEK